MPNEQPPKPKTAFQIDGADHETEQSLLTVGEIFAIAGTEQIEGTEVVLINEGQVTVISEEVVVTEGMCLAFKNKAGEFA